MMTMIMTVMTCMRRRGADNQEVVWHRAPSLLFTSCPYNRHHLRDFSFPAAIRTKFARGRPLGEVSIPPTPRSHSTFDTKLSSLLQMKFEKVSKRICFQQLYPGRKGGEARKSIGLTCDLSMNLTNMYLANMTNMYKLDFSAVS